METTKCDFDELASQLDHNGYCVWPAVFEESVIDRHLADFEASEREHLNGAGARILGTDDEDRLAVLRRRYTFHWQNRNTQELVFNARMLAFLEWYFGETPVMRQPSTRVYSRNTAAHIESIPLRVLPYRAELRLWCALEDIRIEAGPLGFLSGSHQWIGKKWIESLAKTTGAESARAVRRPAPYIDFIRAAQPIRQYIEASIAECIESRTFPVIAPELKKGDAVLFGPDIIHGSKTCLDYALTRKHLTATWSSAGARWYHMWEPTVCAPDSAGFQVPFEKTDLGCRIDSRHLYKAILASLS
jgi:ectoine hydroxylase-related dioxygenase (phytanoyl-CoA dioxygenase family)